VGPALFLSFINQRMFDMKKTIVILRYLDDIAWLNARYHQALFLLRHPNKDNGPESLLKDDIRNYAIAIRIRMEAL